MTAQQPCGHPRMPGIHCDGFHTYAPGWEGRQEHRILYGHTPAPAPTVTVEAPVVELAAVTNGRQRGDDGLTDRQRIVRDHYLAGVPAADTARLLNTTPQAIQSARSHLRVTGRLNRPEETAP